MEPEEHLHRVEIPQILYSVYTQEPFSDCVDCGMKILESAVPYAVEKAVRQGEVVFEYAICAPCMALLMKQFSDESMQNITAYLQEEELDLGTDGDLTCCNRCGGSGTSFEEEHTVTGMLAGSSLLMGPSIICGTCLAGMDEVLSQKTRDAHGEFINSNFPGVPEALDFPVSILGA